MYDSWMTWAASGRAPGEEPVVAVEQRLRRVGIARPEQGQVGLRAAAEGRSERLSAMLTSSEAGSRSEPATR